MSAPRSPLAFRPGQPVTGDDLVVLTGHPTPYGMLEHLSEDWVLAFRELGRRAWLVSTAGSDGLAALQALLAAGRPAAFLAFSGVNWDLLANDRLLYEMVEVPYVGLMFDDPAYFPQRHLVGNPYLALLFTDDDHFGASRALSPITAPRGHFRFGCRPPLDAPRPHAERHIPILFAKSPGDAAGERRAWDTLARPVRSILHDVADAALWQDTTSLWTLVRQRIAADGLSAASVPPIGVATLVARLDNYIRLARAHRVVQALAPLDAVIVGEGWRAHLPRDARARVVASCDMPALLATMGDARICVNVQPNNRFAPHERLIHGMQRGCCVASDAAAPLRERIGEPHFRPFGWTTDLGDVFRDLLADPHATEATGQRAATCATEQWSAVAGAATVLRAVDTLTALLNTRSPISLPAALSA